MSTIPPAGPPSSPTTAAGPAEASGEELLQQLRAALEAERQKHGDEIDLRTLESFAARYRRAIDKTRADISHATNRAAFQVAITEATQGRIVTASTARIEALLRVQEAMRQDLDDLIIEIGNRRDSAAKIREERILNKTARAAIVQAGAAVILVGVTAWYTWRTDQLVRAQVEPSVELVVPKGTASVTVANDGPFPIVDVRVDVEQAAMTPDGHAVSRLEVGPRIPGEPAKSWWYVEKLGAGRHETRSVEDKAQDALNDLAMMEKVQAKGGISGVSPNVQLHAEVFIRLTYRRDVDGKQYSKTKRMQVNRVSNTGKPVLWLDERARFEDPR
jgi:hypothetical protein